MMMMMSSRYTAARRRISQTQAALFYSPVDFTDASDLHQTVVKFIG